MPGRKGQADDLINTIICSLLLVASVLYTGCSATYQVVTIPKTPENLAAYRECQRTTVSAVGYTEQARQQLLRKCLGTLSGLKTQDANGHDEFKRIAPGKNCSQIEYLDWYWNFKAIYYMCDKPESR